MILTADFSPFRGSSPEPACRLFSLPQDQLQVADGGGRTSNQSLALSGSEGPGVLATLC